MKDYEFKDVIYVESVYDDYKHVNTIFETYPIINIDFRYFDRNGGLILESDAHYNALYYINLFPEQLQCLDYYYSTDFTSSINENDTDDESIVFDSKVKSTFVSNKPYPFYLCIRYDFAYLYLDLSFFRSIFNHGNDYDSYRGNKNLKRIEIAIENQIEAQKYKKNFKKNAITYLYHEKNLSTALQSTVFRGIEYYMICNTYLKDLNK